MATLTGTLISGTTDVRVYSPGGRWVFAAGELVPLGHDDTAPVVTFNTSNGSALAVDAVVSATGTDATLIAAVRVDVLFPNRDDWEVVYDGDFNDQWGEGSSVSGVGTTSATVTFVPDAGWPDSDFTARVTVTDRDGNSTTSSLVYTTVASSSSSPVIANVTPATGTELASSTTPIEFDVYDASPGLRLILITIKFTNDQRKFVVHDGSEFIAPFDASTRTGDGTEDVPYHYTLIPRAAGWWGSIEQLFAYAIDQAGNMEGSLP